MCSNYLLCVLPWDQALECYAELWWVQWALKQEIYILPLQLSQCGMQYHIHHNYRLHQQWSLTVHTTYFKTSSSWYPTYKQAYSEIPPRIVVTHWCHFGQWKVIAQSCSTHWSRIAVWLCDLAIAGSSRICHIKLKSPGKLWSMRH